MPLDVITIRCGTTSGQLPLLVERRWNLAAVEQKGDELENFLPELQRKVP